MVNISFEDNNGEMINLQIKISDSDTLEFLEGIDVDLVLNDNGELVIFADEDNTIYSKKLRDLGCIDSSSTIVTTHA